MVHVQCFPEELLLQRMNQIIGCPLTRGPSTLEADRTTKRLYVGGGQDDLLEHRSCSFYKVDVTHIVSMDISKHFRCSDSSLLKLSSGSLYEKCRGLIHCTLGSESKGP